MSLPARIGLGTWRMGESAALRAAEIAAVRGALDLGYRLVDTAEMYGDGGAEQIVGTALEGWQRGGREQLYVVSKVLPQHASHRGTVRACEASLRRLGCQYLDLYLLHWRGTVPLIETLRAFDELRRRGLIRAAGVSNFDLEDLQEWRAAELQLQSATAIGVNQVYYSIAERGIEIVLLPWQRQHGIDTIAYSPLGCGELAQHPLLQELGRERGLTAAQIALAWCLRQPDVTVIPKSVSAARLQQNLAAASIELDATLLRRLEDAFPAPQRRTSLAMV